MAKIEKHTYARGMYVTKSTTLLSFLQKHAMALLLSSHKETVLSYIFCGEIALCRNPYVTKKEHSYVSYNACNDTYMPIDQDFFLQNTIETVYDHKYIVPLSALVMYIPAHAFVSRGGTKLQGVLEQLNFDPNNKICLDCGASTGGFSDCLLQAGAKHIYAVDVGYNQLDYSLKQDARVSSLERRNVLSLQKEDFLYGIPHVAVVDVSFRSLLGLLSFVLPLLQEAYIIALCKPQFEFEYFRKKHKLYERIPFNGVVEMRYVFDVLYNTVIRLHEEGVFVHTILPSQLKGIEGNQEFFFEIYEYPMKTNMSYHDAYKRLCEQAVEKK